VTYFQKILRELMDEKDLDQIELANALRCRQGEILNWVNGKSKPDYDLIKALSDYFNVSADMLLDTNFVD